MFDSNKNISELKIYLKKTVSVTRNNNIVEEPTIGDQGDVMSKYPKTDYTYSRLSKDRVELAPGQIAVPNMSRPSLHSVRHSLSSQDLNVASTTSSYFSDSELRQRWLSSTQNTYQNSRGFDGMSDSEVDETDNWRQQSSVNLKTDNRWKIVKLMTFIWTTIVTTTTTVTSKLFGSDGGAARHHYTNNYYTYSSINTNKTRYSAFKEKMKKKRVWIPLLFLLFLLPALILIYAKPEYKQRVSSSIQNLNDYIILAIPNNFTFDFMKNYSNMTFPSIPFPNVSVPRFSLPTIDFEKFNLSESYNDYKSMAANKVLNISQFVQVISQNCYNELIKLWNGII